jgi:hypothetical protein
LNLCPYAYVYIHVKRTIACLFAATLLLALPQISRADGDQFTQIQNNPNTYWVLAPAGQPAPPQSGYAPTPGPYAYYYSQPGCVAGPAPYYYGPPRAYYGAPPAYYGPPVALGYYGGRYGSRVVVGLPGLFFGFHFH